MANPTDILQGLFGIGATVGLQNDAIQKAEAVGVSALNDATAAGNAALKESEFKPYSITSGTGTVDALELGGRFNGLDLELSPEIQAMVDAGRISAGDFLGRANQNTGTQTTGMLEQLGLGGSGRTEAEIFEMLNAVQRPGQERERLALEERLFSQGRGGVRTEQFGGTPEELAIAKAREEQRAGTSVSAFDLARQDEQTQFNNFAGLFNLNTQNKQVEAGIGNDLFTNSFLPMDDLRRTATLGADVGSIDQQARSNAVNTAAGLVESGLQAKVNAQQQATQARISRNQDIVNLLIGGTNAAGDTDRGLFGAVTDFFGGGSDAVTQAALDAVGATGSV